MRRKFPVCVRNRRPIRFKQPEQPRDGKRGCRRNRRSRTTHCAQEVFLRSVHFSDTALTKQSLSHKLSSPPAIIGARKRGHVSWIALLRSRNFACLRAKECFELRTHCFSINRLKLCNYLSRQRKRAPLKLEHIFRVTHVL